MIEKTELRYYSMVLYSLMPIQKGIQTQHSTTEYTVKYPNDDVYMDWATNHKTTIVLDGGTSNSGLESYYGYEKQKGGLELLVDELEHIGIKYSVFKEPDLNYCISSIGVIIPEQVFNDRKYPPFKAWLMERYGSEYKNYMVNTPNEDEYATWLLTFSNDYMTCEQAFDLRMLLKPLNLAR